MREVPSTAQVRGVFFTMIGDHLARAGHEQAARKILGRKRWIHALYPVSELLEASARAAPYIADDPREAMRTLWSGAAQHVAGNWFGRVLQRVMRPDPASALRWIESTREHQCNYGQWRVEQLGPTHVMLHMFDEYIWIDSAHRGGCEGLLDACNVRGTVEPSLDTPFSGRLEIRWTLDQSS